MEKLISILCALSISAALAACAAAPDKGNSSDVQRAHADKAKGELSSEIKKQ
jgi:hypothetical protein